MRPIDADALLDDAMKSMWYFTIKSFVDRAPTIAPPPNDPLTLEELREMDGEPMWVVPLLPTHEYDDMEPRWAIVRAVHFRSGSDGDGYGHVWVAYRRKPEESD